MSQAVLSRPVRPSTPRLSARKAAASRAETEATLRDLAFVLALTQRVRTAIVREQAAGAAE